MNHAVPAPFMHNGEHDLTSATDQARQSENTASMQTDSMLPRTSAGSAGLSASAIEDLLRAMESAGLELHSFMLARRGQVVAEAWWHPYGTERVHMMHSVTKALTSTGVGVAVHDGLFSLDDRVISFFPERAPADLSGHLAQMRIRDLLTQTSGHDHGVSGSVWRSIATSWIDEFLKIPVKHLPGTHFQYSSATSFMLSAIVTRTSGQSLQDYLAARVFEPVGMRSVLWDMGPEGINPGGNGASMTSEDLLRLAILYAADGCWNGNRILPEGWVAAASQAAASRPYGYHWWVWPEQPGFFAFGAFGQYAFVFPEHELALVTTAAVPGSISRPDIGIPPLVWEYLPSLIAGADSSSESELSLTRYTQSRSLSLGGVDVPDNQACTVNGLRFKAESNADDICAIRIDFNGSSCCVQFEYRHHTHSINAGLDRTYVESTTTLPGAGLHHGYEPGQLATVAWGYWHEPNVFTLKCQYIETAFCDTFIFAFDKGVLNMQRSVNVNGGNTQRPIIRAHAEDPATS